MDPAHQNAQRVQDDAIGPDEQGTTDSGDSVAERPWSFYNLLCFDGGGIRGIWTLLVLQKLMYYIASIEEDLNHDDDRDVDHETCSSFLPLGYPLNVSQIPQGTTQSGNRGRPAPRPCCQVSRSRRYLPCHYFDFIGGSSTGALIAIMLGRFRMTVDDCIEEYKQLGGEIFGRSRVITEQKTLAAFTRPHYPTGDVERVFERFCERRRQENDENETNEGGVQFAADRDDGDVCKTFVTTLQSDESSSEQLYLFRTYNSEEKALVEGQFNAQPRQPTGLSNPTVSRATTGLSQATATTRKKRKRQKLRRINNGRAHKVLVWKIARAATAAELYFRPMKIEINRREMTFTDGGFGVNNPTRVGIDEIEHLTGSRSIHAVVSVGTARKDEEEKRGFIKGIVSRILKWTNRLAETEGVHESVYNLEDTNDYHNLRYFRFNHPQTLDVRLDEWRPGRFRSRFRTGSSKLRKPSGHKTIKKIEEVFKDWASKQENHDDLRECAELLVQHRRSRTQSYAEWERFATCARYYCKKCQGNAYHSRNRDHFRTHYAISDPNIHNAAWHPNGNRSLEDALDDCREQWRYQAASAV